MVTQKIDWGIQTDVFALNVVQSQGYQSLCCEEILTPEDKLRNAEDVARDCSCVTQSPRFYWICLDSEALNVALLSMTDVRTDT